MTAAPIWWNTPRFEDIDTKPRRLTMAGVRKLSEAKTRPYHKASKTTTRHDDQTPNTVHINGGARFSSNLPMFGRILEQPS